MRARQFIALYHLNEKYNRDLPSLITNCDPYPSNYFAFLFLSAQQQDRVRTVFEILLSSSSDKLPLSIHHRNQSCNHRLEIVSHCSIKAAQKTKTVGGKTKIKIFKRTVTSSRVLRVFTSTAVVTAATLEASVAAGGLVGRLVDANGTAVEPMQC